MKLKKTILSFVITIFMVTLSNAVNAPATEVNESNTTEMQVTEADATEMQATETEATGIQETETDTTEMQGTETECEHNYTSEVTTEPTCTTEGRRTFTCSKCKDSYKEPIAVSNHTEVVDKAVAATCMSIGKTAGSHCSVCGKILVEQREIPMLKHSYKTTIKKATASKNGSVTKKCAVCGEINKAGTYTIYRPKTVKLSKTSAVYTGKEIRPSVTVTDSKGKKLAKSKYTVSYKKNKNIGTATVTVTMKGKYYSGKLSRTFTIVPKGTNIVHVDNHSRGKRLLVVWNKQTKQTTGYQIQYATKSNFKNAKTVWIKNGNTTSEEITGLRDNTTYYVRIRTYKTIKVNGKSKKIYSAWSYQCSAKTAEKPVLNTRPVASMWAGPYELYVLHLDDNGYPYFYGKWGGSANMDADHLARTDACIEELERYSREIYVYNGLGALPTIETNNGRTTITSTEHISQFVSWEGVGTHDGIPVVRRYLSYISSDPF